jgi:mannose-6-phosphate isomerase-like protein (cupin superfamily)
VTTNSQQKWLKLYQELKGVKDEPAAAAPPKAAKHSEHQKEKVEHKSAAASPAPLTSVILSDPAAAPVELPGPARRVIPQLYHAGVFETAIEIVDPASEIPWHSHDDSTELFFFISGEGTLYHQPVDESSPVVEVPFKADSSFAVPPKTKFVFHDVSPVGCFLTYIDSI